MTHSGAVAGSLEQDKRPGEMYPGQKPLTHYAWLSLLRAFGVLLVLVYHFFPWLMPGGFIGVDVFLVFSGYLITSLLVSEFKKQGKIDLLAFYKRRFRRLFPALVALLLVVLPLTLTISADFRADIARQVAAVLSWTSNFYEISIGRSYADTLLPHLFVHTWTLGVEMHYYLIWGLILMLLMPLFVSTVTKEGRKTISRSRKMVALLAALLALASYGVMQIMLIGAEDPSAAYYSTFSHAYPLLIGSAVGALAGFGRSWLVARFERLQPTLAIVLVAISLTGIALMAILLSFENLLVYRVGLLLTALLVSFVILIGRGAQERLQHRQEPKVLQFIADRSYSIYLFHWPLMIIVLEWARALFGKVDSGFNPAYIAAAIFALLLTFIAAHLSYRFVERRFSKRRGVHEEKSPHDTSAASYARHADETLHEENRVQSANDVSHPRHADRTLHEEYRVHSANDARHPRHADETLYEENRVHSANDVSHPRHADRTLHEEYRVHSTNDANHTRHVDGAPYEEPGKRLRTIVPFSLSKLALGVLATVLAMLSVFALVTASQRTSIEENYQMGLLEIDLNQMEYSRQSLLHTANGGNAEGEPAILITPGSITIIGDSVTIFPAEDLTNLTGAFVDADVGRAMVNGIRILQELQESRILSEFVVVALATNTHADSFESAVAICEGMAPGHRLIFVTAFGAPEMEELNEQLRTLPQMYPFVTIADWGAAIDGREYLLAADGYHLGGQEAVDIYISVIMQALEEAKDKPTS